MRIHSNILKLYQEKLNLINLNYKEKIIKSSYGKTNVIISLNNKPPLIIIHGLNSAAPFSLDLFSFLDKKYKIFAIDILGQPNKSEFVRLKKKDNSYGKWLLEIINHFKLENVTLCGISFGAFPILKSLIIDDGKIKEAFLISPAGITHGNLWNTIIKFMIPLKKFQKTKNDFYLKNCLSTVYDDFNKLSLEFLKEVFLNFNMDFSPTPNFKKSELKTIKVPVTIIASKNDFFVPAKKIKKKCDDLGNLKEFILLKDSKHIPSKTILENIILKK